MLAEGKYRELLIEKLREYLVATISLGVVKRRTFEYIYMQVKLRYVGERLDGLAESLRKTVIATKKRNESINKT